MTRIKINFKNRKIKPHLSNELFGMDTNFLQIDNLKEISFNLL